MALLSGAGTDHLPVAGQTGGTRGGDRSGALKGGYFEFSVILILEKKKSSPIPNSFVGMNNFPCPMLNFMMSRVISYLIMLFSYITAKDPAK